MSLTHCELIPKDARHIALILDIQEDDDKPGQSACIFACCYEDKEWHLPDIWAELAIFPNVRVETDIASFFQGRERENLVQLPSFYPFLYLNLKNLTFNDLLRIILTNKVTLKKIQHKEDAIGIN